MESVRDRASLVTSTLIDHIQRVDLRVRNVGAALSFYRDVVGLEVVEQDDERTSLAGSEGSVFLTLDSTGVGAPADARSTGLFHTAIRFPTRPSLGDALARLAEARLAIGAGDHLVSEALYIDDPDGNGVELYWDRPQDQWPAPTADTLVPMATLPVDLDGLLAEGLGLDAVGESSPQKTDVGHVHLQVSDLDATTRFYSEGLGLDITGKLGDQAGFFSSNGYHHNIGANTWRSRGSKPARRESAGLERIVFAVTDAQKLEDLRARLLEQGLEVAGDAGHLVVVHDPDGIELHFVTE